MSYLPVAMFGMGPYELLIVGGIILLLFGHRLPSLMRSLGRGVVEFKKGIHDVDDDEVAAVTDGKPNADEKPSP